MRNGEKGGISRAISTRLKVIFSGIGMGEDAGAPPYIEHIIDICGACNARCPYCPAGTARKTANRFMDPDLLEKILEHQRAEGLLSPGQCIQLYAYGEPFLHPRLDDILAVVGELGYKAAFSSNFIRSPRIREENLRVIRLVVFSTCGLTEETYRPIYGADVQRVLKNLDDFLAVQARGNPCMQIVVNWLKYRVGTSELEEARAYFESRGCTFRPILPLLNDVERMIDIRERGAPLERLSSEFRYLDLEKVFSRMEELAGKQPDYSCPQDRTIVVGETGRLRGCCVIHPDHPEADLGDILKLSRREIFKRKRRMKTCSKCRRFGIAQFVHVGLFD